MRMVWGKHKVERFECVVIGKKANDEESALDRR